MKLKAVEKVAGWQYLSRYDVKYETPEGGEKIYEMFSRDPGIDSPEKLLHPRVDAVMIIMTDEPGEHMLLIREFRLEKDVVERRASREVDLPQLRVACDMHGSQLVR